MSESISETISDGGPAFPSLLPGGTYCLPGLSMLDYFAGQAMQGLLTADTQSAMTCQKIASIAYKQAIAMLNAREAIQARGAK